MGTIREDVVQELVATGKWSADAARLGERAGYKCEYCDTDLLASPEAYKLWEVDHIVPQSMPDCDVRDFNNLALACRHCNWSWKSDWDPRTVVGANATREQLVAAVRDYVAKQRARASAELAAIRAIVGRAT